MNRYAISADSGTEQKGDSFVVKSSDTEAFDDETPAAAPVEVSADLSFQQIGQAYKGASDCCVGFAHRVHRPKEAQALAGR